VETIRAALLDDGHDGQAMEDLARFARLKKVRPCREKRAGAGNRLPK